MKIIEMTPGSVCPRKGDLVLIQGTVTADRVEPYRVALVKDMPNGPEIILNRRRNVWFDWRKYLAGQSWVTDCRVVLP